MKEARVMSLVIGRLGMKLGNLKEIMLLLDSVDKVEYFICNTRNENWMLLLIIWSSDKTGFCGVKQIWEGVGMEVIKGISNFARGEELYLENDSKKMDNSMPRYLEKMNSGGKSYVIERKGYSKREGTKPLDIVCGLSEACMFCVSALDPAHQLFLRCTANKEMMALIVALTTRFGGDEFVQCTRKCFRLRLADSDHNVMVTQLTVKTLRQIVSFAASLGISPLALIDGPLLCSWCAAEGASNRCTGCEIAYYCSKTCQKRHWRAGHKDKCNK